MRFFSLGQRAAASIRLVRPEWGKPGGAAGHLRLRRPGPVSRRMRRLLQQELVESGTPF
ncbi:hypothetical protein [Desulfocurvibacter africanus]|uniref:hypothetical protein n=1 Tax=Desulfocurvibacter africanus TaxID=873 RepID=UPI0002E6B7A5|nr:hypothetical protein [Desulfocurvibacter africanus]